MDINRPFGNARDDNGNSVIDEPFEANSVYQVNAQGLPILPAPGWPEAGLAARQRYAKHLYILAMATLDILQLDRISGRYLGYNLGPDPATWDPAEKAASRQLTARQIAQWAVNVVDFRDRDSIMTPFEYDVNPFTDDDAGSGTTTWNVDDNISTPESATYRGLVWGCERPELLIHETLAFHDRRTEDLSDPNGKAKPPSQQTGDSDFDQRKKPQGSLFIELKNPWTALQPQAGEFGDAPNGGVDLRRSVGGSPVWRMAIVLSEAAPQGSDKTNPIYRDPDTATTTTFRSIYFTDLTGVATPPDNSGNVWFFPSGNNATAEPIKPGEYALIGPPGDNPVNAQNGKKTFFGRVNNDPANEIAAERLNDPTPGPGVQYVDMASGAAGSSLRVGGQVADNTIRVVKKVVVDSCGATVAIPQQNDSPRMSISEPDTGYDKYEQASPGRYYFPTKDDPLDYTRTDWDSPMGRAIRYNGMGPEGFRIAAVHLQRLADPTQPYNATTNPYRTIDSSPIDLFALNGWDDDTSEETRAGGVQTGTNLLPLAPNGKAFYSTYQRGKYNAQAPSTPAPHTPWIQYVDEADTLANQTAGTPNAALTVVFQFPVLHTLGYLNDTYAAAWIPSGTYQGEATGVPPTPWLVWNNRPFANAMELMLVPTAGSSRLLNVNYGLVRNAADGKVDLTKLATTQHGYFSTSRGGNPYDVEDAPFLHLPNFFHAAVAASPNDQPVHRHRLLELLGVPSPFLGTQLLGNPLSFPSTAWTPPFNRIPYYREPGKVNLNTVFDPAVYAGLCNNLNSLFAPFQPGELALSRQGYPGATALNLPQMTGDYPSCFANPFRSSAGAQLQPVGVPELTGTGSEINATLLRRSPSAPNQPLFQFASQDPSCDTERNAFFRYQGLQRLANSVTTQSNVYAVWVTVGYFEVSPWTGPDLTAHPDGLCLGAELGLDTGEVKRHRAFYILDRSIPVGFQRGQNLNVDKAILLKRYIE
jgi:hypothetical protein